MNVALDLTDPGTVIRYRQARVKTAWCTEATEKYDAMINDDSCSTSGGEGVRQNLTKEKRTPVEPAKDEGGGSLRRLDNGQVRRKQRPGSTVGIGLVGGSVIGPRTHLKLVSQELEWERKFRDDQLSRILKALIAFETRLKNEQSRIKQQLYEKDDVINRQNCTINRMKRKLAGGSDDEEIGGAGGATGTELDEVTQYCPKCRKNYYRLECRTNGTQTFEYCRGEDGAESVNTENLSLNSVEYASSSEEQESSLYVRANSFKDARRSRKYTSKRSYQGYQRGTASRASSFKSNASGPAIGTLAKLVEARTGPHRLSRPHEEESGHEAYVNIEPNANVPKIVIYENYESDKENKRLDQNRQQAECNNYDNVEPYSNRIDTLHGIHGRGGHEQQKQDQRADGPKHDYHLVGAKGGDGSEQMELDDGTIFYEANAGSVSNQQKYTEGMEMKQTIETNDDWYASASDMEDSDTALGKPYSNAAVNPVLECVNQILLQQSMDGFGDSNKDTAGDGGDEEHYIKAQQPITAPPPAKEHQPGAVRSKRVHFSTQNSMVQVPRISLQSSTTLSSGSQSSSRKEDKVSPTYEIQSIYSNEYEPIGSEQNSYSNYYVDMESKLGSEDREREQALAEKRKTPPALPPKPANLLKLQQLSKGAGQQQRQQTVMTPVKGRGTQSSAQSDIAESEPDYCSISEIQDSVKCVQIVAEIHKDACEDDYSIVDEEERGKPDKDVRDRQEQDDASASNKKSAGGTELEESFADVPKLPNVAEIVPPKKEPLNKFISQDNYITKSSSSSSSKGSHAGVGTIVSTPSKKDGEFREQLSEIIAEINKQSPAIRNASKKQIPVKEHGVFRGVSQIPSVTFQSKLKPVDKLSFLSKASTGGLSGSIPSLNHSSPKLSSSIGRPSIKPPSMLKSSLSTKALSSTNLALGTSNMGQFGSPIKSVSYIPNLKSQSVHGSPLAASAVSGSGTVSAGSSPIKSSNSSPVKKVASALNLSAGTGSIAQQASVAPTAPVIIAEDSKLPIQAEFDWYNLDAEYGKSNQPDVIVEADPSSNGETDEGMGDDDDRVSCSESLSKKTPVADAENNAAEERSSTIAATIPKTSSEKDTTSECGDEELENVEYNLDEEYKSLGPIVPPPDIIQKSAPQPPLLTTPPKNGKIPYNSLSFKELMQLNETPKMAPEAKAKAAKANGSALGAVENGPTAGGRNYEHFLDDSGLCSKPIILPRKKRVYYSGPFV
uniref:Uncharacterized protein n=1 Tax=Anopheles farauti TaxID=69004 RepID=A0A182QLM0_9DIPT